MTREFLEALNLDKDTVDKILDENSRDIGREKQKAEQLKDDLEKVQEQLGQRDKDMENLKKSAADVEGIKKQLEELQSKYNTETEQYKTQLADRDYSDAMARMIADKDVKFSSKAAEKAFMADLKAKALTLKDGALDGFDTFLKSQKESDPAAFEAEKPDPTFVKPTGAGGPPEHVSAAAQAAKNFTAQFMKKE